MPRIAKDRTGSNFWRGVCTNWDHVQHNMQWRMGNGRMINFWIDNWLPNVDNLAAFVTEPEPNINQNVCVSDFINYEGGWNHEMLLDILPMHICNKILSINAPDPNNVDDVSVWKLNNDGEYSNSSTYKSLINNAHIMQEPIFERIWRLQVPERLRCFMWKIARGALLTNVERTRRHLSTNPNCPICGDCPESKIHVFRDCRIAQEVWKCLGAATDPIFLNGEFMDWLELNLAGGPKKNTKWSTMYVVALDCIWMTRNKFIFQNCVPKIHEIVEVIHFRSNELSHITYANVSTQHMQHMSLTDKRWRPPLNEWIKLNCDGEVTNCGSMAGCGGAARNIEGEYVIGYSINLGASSIIKAECYAILFGLKLLIERGFTKVVVETDSLEALSIMLTGCVSNHLCWSYWNEVNRLMQKIEVEIKHIFREANKVAGIFAKEGLNQTMQCHIFENVPTFCYVAFLAYKNDTQLSRGR